MNATKRKRGLSLLLVFLMVLSLLPTVAPTEVHASGWRNGICDLCGVGYWGGDENICEDCGYCATCIIDWVLHCDECFECIASIASEQQCKSCEKFLCDSCVWFCESTGDKHCDDCYEEVCPQCGLCNICVSWVMCLNCFSCGNCMTATCALCDGNACNFCADIHECADAELNKCEDCSQGMLCPVCLSVCFDCADNQCETCFTCDQDADICGGCNMGCTECVERVCEGCYAACSECASFCEICGLCENCVTLCESCGEYCADCAIDEGMGYCLTCNLCERDDSTCYGCNEGCENCALLCDGCGYGCSTCSTVCRGCGSGCDECAEVCWNCEDICSGCGLICEECHACENCCDCEGGIVLTCPDCGRNDGILCLGCRLFCSECVVVCEDCHQSCSECDGICRTCRSVCMKTDGNIFCAECGDCYDCCKCEGGPSYRYMLDYNGGIRLKDFVYIPDNLKSGHAQAGEKFQVGHPTFNGDFAPPEGLAFLSWNTEPDGSGTTYTVGGYVEITMPEGGITLYAIWVVGCKGCDATWELLCADCGQCTSCNGDWICEICGICNICSGNAFCSNCKSYCDRCVSLCGDCGACGDCDDFCAGCGSCGDYAYFCSDCGLVCNYCAILCEDCETCTGCMGEDLCAGCEALCFACAGQCPDCEECLYCCVCEEHTHYFGGSYKKDSENHWMECPCGEKSGSAAHTPGAWIVDLAATETAVGSRHRECTVCTHVTTNETIPATGAVHTHTSSAWIVDLAATETTPGSRHKECTACGEVLETGAIPATGISHIHTVSAWIVDVAATATTPGSRHKECTVCGETLETETIPAIGISPDIPSGGSFTPPKTDTEKTVESIEKAEPGDTVTIDLGDKTEVEKEILDAIAGKDITVEITVGDVVWIIEGTDVPLSGLTALDLGVTVGTGTIPVDVINAITGDTSTVQLTLNHEGRFGFTLVLQAPLGKENAGLYANLYFYNKSTGEMEFRTVAVIGEDGNAKLVFSHASEYAIVIDSKAHDRSNPFTDVTESNWFYGDVQYVYGAELMTGTAETLFSPYMDASRAMIVTILYRLAGEPAVSGNGGFADVPAGTWYANAVAWAQANGIADGYSAESFGPNDPITREQMAVILMNYARFRGDGVSALTELSGFSDAGSVSSWAADAIAWANAEGLINGKGGGILDPKGNATRAEVAAILTRFCENIVK